MKASLIIAVVIASLQLGAAEKNAEASSRQRRKISPEKAAEIKQRLNDPNSKGGGFLVQPGSQKGVIGVFDAQARFPTSEVSKVIATMRQMMHHAFVEKKIDKFSGLPSREDVEKRGATVAVYIVDDPALPILLAAPEDRWSLLNVAKIGKGLKDDAAGKSLIDGRFRGELQRAFALACGAWTSQHKNSMSSVVDQSGIDSLNPDDLMGDLALRYMPYLKSLGITPARRVPYALACMEGWAPEPKTEAQKEVWNKIHAMPTNPIVIKPEKKPEGGATK